jgi:heavy metal sensor kinase
VKLFRPNIRYKLTVWFGLSLALILSVYSVGLYGFLRHNLYGELDRKLREDIEAVQETIQDLPSNGDLQDFTKYKDVSTHDIRERWLLEIWSENYQNILSIPQRNESPLGRLDSKECIVKRGDPETLELEDGLAIRTLCSKVEAGDRFLIIRVARSAERVVHELNELLWMMLLGVPVAILLAMIGGYWLARTSLLPVQKMTEQAQKISVDRLHDRLDIVNANDELGRLAATFNQTFDRLEKSFLQMRQFTSDASHELRTPLTAIRTMGEVALREDKTAAEYREVLSSVLEETDELRNLVDSLLTLSRADAGQIRLNKQPLDLSILVNETLDHLQVLAEEKGQEILRDLPPGLTITGDRSVLRQAIINLVENAIKYSAFEKTIKIRTFKDDASLFVEVTDEGPGILSEHQVKVFERFYRIDSGRSRDEGGTGLGLSIAKWAIESHGGSIKLSSAPGKGSVFTITLPLS